MFFWNKYHNKIHLFHTGNIIVTVKLSVNTHRPKWYCHHAMRYRKGGFVPL